MLRASLLALTLALLAGCYADTVRVTSAGGRRLGKATRTYTTVDHVAQGSTVKVGNRTCDVYPLVGPCGRCGWVPPSKDPMVLLVPRGEPGTVRYSFPGTSGSPAYDALGRYVGAVSGHARGDHSRVRVSRLDGRPQTYRHGVPE